ncbi:MAG: glycosyltransferase [Candidatus Cybelea sp.]
MTWPCNAVFNSFFVAGRLIIRSLIDHAEVTSKPHDADLRIHVGTPEDEQAWMYAYRQEKLIAYTFAEASAIPPKWTAVLNRCREVWVPSKFSADVFASAGVQTKIRIVPLGIDVDAAPKPNINRNDPTFTILWQGVVCRRLAGTAVVDGDRKRGYLVECAFKRANLPRTRLILKSIPLQQPRYESRLEPIWEICETVSAAEGYAIDDATDVFVWPTMGEAFGLLPLEKLSRGITCRVTAWSGVLEYLKDFPGHSLERFSLQDFSYNGVTCQMADVDEDALVEALRECFEGRAEIRKARRELSEKTRDLWNFRRVMLPQVRRGVDEAMAHA